MKRFLSIILSIAVICLNCIPMTAFAGTDGVIGAEKVKIEGEDFDSFTKLDNAKDPTVLGNNPTGTSGGKYVGDFMTGTVLLYEVDVQNTGMHQFDFWIAGLDEGAIKIATENNEIDFCDFSPTGDWQKYVNIKLNVWLEAGKQIIKIENTRGTWNFDYMEVQFMDGATKRLEGESFDSFTKVEDAKDPKVLSNNPTGTSGGKYVGDYMKGTVLSYEIDAEKAGMYQFSLSVAGLDAGAVKITTENNESDSSNFSSTGDWQNYVRVKLNVWLEEGKQIIQVENLKGTWNFDYMDIQYVSSEKVENSILEDAKICGSEKNIENLIDGQIDTVWEIVGNTATITLRYNQEYDISSLVLKHAQGVSGEIQITTSNGNQMVNQLDVEAISTDIPLNDTNVSWLRLDFTFDTNENYLQELDLFGKINLEKEIGEDILLEGFASGNLDGYYEEDEMIDSFVVVGNTLKFVWANSRVINTIKISNLPKELGDTLSGMLIYGENEMQFSSPIINGTSEIEVDNIDVLDFELCLNNLSGTNDLGIIQIFSKEAGILATANYDNIIFTNRWKSDILVEKNGQVEYVKATSDITETRSHAWKLEQVEGNYYTIQNLGSENYVYLPENTEHTDAVKMKADVQNDKRGQWRLKKVNGYMMFYNAAEPTRALAVEHQSNVVTACPEALPAWYSAHWSVSSATKMEEHYYKIEGNTIDGTAGKAIAYTPNSIISNASGENKIWRLSEDLSNLPKFSSDTTIIDAVYNLSLEESVKNQFQGKYGIVFNTGVNWNKVWTRDTAMSIDYSLAWLYPAYSMNCVKEKIINTPNVFEQDTGTGGSYPTSVDKIIMAIPTWDIYLTTGDKEFLNEMYPVIKNTIEQDDHVALEKETGLYLGETGGLDHRAKTYPDWMDENEYDSIVNIAESKSSIVNIIYAKAFQVLSEAGKVLGKPEEEISYWNQRYEDMKKAINKYFWMEDRGMYASFLYPEYMGAPMADKVDVISNGYAMMFDIANDEQKAQIAENYPMVTYGATTVWPQKNGLKQSEIYHNRGVWPGWEATLMLGAKENGNNQLAAEIWSSCIRGAAMCLTNKEVINYANGSGVASDRQLWSIAGTISGYYRVLFGMEYLEEGIQLTPYIPEWAEGPFELNDYKYRNATLNICMQGNGDIIDSYKVNGIEVDKNYVIPSDSTGELNIEITMKDSGEKESINKTDQSWVVCPDMPEMTLDGDTLHWEPVENLAYKLWNGKEFIDVTGKNSYVIDKESGYQVYSLMSVDKNGISSEMSKPIKVNSEEIIKIEAEDGKYDENKFATEVNGYSGSGYVVDERAASSPLEITVDIPKGKAGNYYLNVYYNNQGDATTTTNCAIRSLYVDDKDVGTIIFPLTKVAFDRSTTVDLCLEEGKHTLKIFYDNTNWYDKNMNENGRNDVAYDYLQLCYKGQEIDKSDLKALIRYTEEQIASNSYEHVLPVVKELLESALSEAKAIDETVNATQEQVDEAYGKLLEKVHLLGYIGNSEKLEILVDVVKGMDLSIYTKESREAVEEALKAAEDLLSKENVLQEDYDAAKATLEAAVEALEEKETVNKEKLQKLVNEAKKYEDTIDKYTPNTAEIFTKVLNDARVILENEDATQEEVDAAYDALLQAIFGLRFIPDKSKLEELLGEAEKIDINRYTEKTASVFSAAFERAKEVLQDENATETDIRLAEKNLQTAIAKLEEKTNDSTVKEKEESKKNSAKTGDATNVAVFLMTGIVAVAVLFGNRKKREE